MSRHDTLQESRDAIVQRAEKSRLEREVIPSNTFTFYYKMLHYFCTHLFTPNKMLRRQTTASDHIKRWYKRCLTIRVLVRSEKPNSKVNSHSSREILFGIVFFRHFPSFQESRRCVV